MRVRVRLLTAIICHALGALGSVLQIYTWYMRASSTTFQLSSTPCRWVVVG